MEHAVHLDVRLELVDQALDGILRAAEQASAAPQLREQRGQLTGDKFEAKHQALVAKLLGGDDAGTCRGQRCFDHTGCAGYECSVDVVAKIAKMGAMASASSVPPAKPLSTVSATEAKNNFGAVLDRVLSEGRVSITKHDEVRAVILSLPEYEALVEKREDSLDSLSREFDALVERMQTPKARSAGRALFDATPQRLGRAAVTQQRSTRASKSQRG
jgi:antitoxin Phd